MGIVLPTIVDEALDLIGINWPNVDEDDYYEMATSMRDFAEKFEGHGGDAHKAITRILSSSEGWAVDSMEKHWSHVKTNHLEKVPEVARLFADACDAVARIIVGMKTKAGIELGVLAGTVVASLAATPLTLGLSAGLAAVEIAAMREIVRRLVKEAIEEIIAELTAKLTEPVIAKLESLVTDMVLDLAEGAFNPSGGPDSGGTTLASAGTALASAGGSGGAGKRTHIDHAEFENGAGKVSLHGGDLNSQSSIHLGKTKGAFGRTKGRDPFTKDFDHFFDDSIGKVGKVLTRITKHVSEEIPDRVKAASRHQKDNDRGVGGKADGVEVNSVGDGKGGDGGGTGGGHRGGAPDDGPRGGDEDQRKGPDHPDTAKDDPTKNGVPEKRRRCENDPVDVASGQMLMTQRDVFLPGVLPLVLRRTHLSDYRWGHWFGANWASTLDERIELDSHGEGAVWAREDGSMLIYPRLPQPSDLDGVMPVNGPALAMFHAGQDNGATTYRIEDGDGGVSRFFTGSWLNESPAYWLCELEDRNHNGVTITRSGTGAPQEVVHDGGYRIAVEVADRRVRTLGLRTPKGPVVLRRFDYDGSGFVQSVTNAVDATMRFTYDVRGAMTSWTDSNNSTFGYVYDAAARVVRTNGPGGYLSSTFAYEELESGRITRYTDSTGATTAYRINGDYQVVAETGPLGHTKTYEFESAPEATVEAQGDVSARTLPAPARAERDRLLSTTDQLGRCTRFGYDEAGNLSVIVRPDGKESTASYNILGLPVSVTGFDGRTWHQAYDDSGNRVSVTDPEGKVTRYAYGDKGRLASIAEPTGAVTRFVTNLAGLPTQVTEPQGAVSVHAHDAFGRITRMTDRLGGTTSIHWSAEGKILESSAADGSSESWTYDGEGNCLTHTDRVGGVSRFEYTHFDLLASRTGPDGERHEFTHDTELRLTQVTNPLGLTWNYTFDAAGRLIAETDFDDRTRTYTYDAAGQLITRTTPLGRSINFERNVLGRTIRKDADGKITTFAYDTSGQLVEAAGPGASLTLERDENGRVRSEIVAGRRLVRHYDEHGRPNGRTTPSGAQSTWSYDAAGRREELSTAGRTLHFTRNAAGQEVARHLGGHLTLEHAYDEMGRRESQTVTGTEGPLRRRDYQYRADGNLVRIDDTRAGTRTFDLDTNGRVVGVQARNWTESYAYDAMGNQTHATWPERHPGLEAQGERVHGGSRIQRAGRVRYEYDDAGRTTLRQKARLSAKPDTWRYTWDAEDQLTQVVTPDGTTWRYEYDALGRRTAKQRTADDGTIAERVDFTWDGATLCEQTTHTSSSSGSVTLTWDHDGHRPLAQTERHTGSGTGDESAATALTASQEEIDSRFYVIVTDLVGTPTELLDEQGNISWHTRTTLWGTTAWSTNSTTYTPLRFPGQYYDPETGLHYNYFRHYDPETAHYLTLDPLGLVPAPNPGTYVHNPHRWVDLLGLAPDCGIDDDTYDAIAESHGTSVAEGVDHILSRMRDGSPSAADHNIAGIGDDPHALADYLKSWQGNTTHVDSQGQGGGAAYDSSRVDGRGRGVAIIELPYRIQAYHYDPDSFFSETRFKPQ